MSFAKSRRIGLILTLIAVVVHSANADDPKPAGTIIGKLVDPEGKTVAGAKIALSTRDNRFPSEVTLGQGVTDAEGRFRLDQVEPFASNLSVVNLDTEGFTRFWFSPRTVTVFDRAETDLGTIRLNRGRVYKGQVVDFDGKPRADASVVIAVRRHTMGHTVEATIPDQTLKTDASGRFVTPPLPVGFLGVTARVEERQLAHAKGGRIIVPGGEEDIGVIKLEPDVPFTATIVDEEGRGIDGVRIGGTVGYNAVTDVKGRFTLRGFGPNPSFQLNVNKQGYSGLVGRVTVTDKGIGYAISQNYQTPSIPPSKELVVTLKRAGWIEGLAVDTESGEPVKLDQVTVCNFSRKPNGEVVLNGCRSQFESTGPGTFRASYPAPDEYHLTLAAAGYFDAEAFTPKVNDLRTIGGIVVRMTKKPLGANPQLPKESIFGVASRDGKPITNGWARSCLKPRVPNAPNAFVARGRTIVGHPLGSGVPIRDGAFTLNLPYQNQEWFVVIEEPGHAPTMVGPIAVAKGEHKKVDVSCVEGGEIRGRVKGVPAGWEGHAWVIAFTRNGFLVEVQVDRSGEFTIPNLPPGEYGLKVGHDAYEDAETYPGFLAIQNPDSFKESADPWKRAKIVKVESGKPTEAIEVEWPQ